MGSSYSAPPAGAQTAQTINAYTQGLPGFINATNRQVLPSAQAALTAAQQVNPAYAKLGLDEINQFGVPYANAGAKVASANAVGQSQAAQDALSGPGKQLATTAQEINKQANPGYYQASEAAGPKVASLVNSVNLNGLSPGEQNSVERSLNQSNASTGNLGLNNATNNVSNAMNFGGAFNNKLGIANQTIGTATNFMNAANNPGYNAVSTAFGQPTQSNTGTTQYGSNTSSAQPFGNPAYTAGSQFLSGIQSLQGQTQQAAGSSAAGSGFSLSL